MPTAIVAKTLSQITPGFYAVLKGDNGQTLGHTEIYTRKHNVLKLLSRYFQNFKVVDTTSDKKDPDDRPE